MLSSLHIKNYALIDEVFIDFSPGLNVITGETGSGKSVVMQALLAGGGLSALQTSVLVTGAPFAIIIALAAKNLLSRLKALNQS